RRVGGEIAILDSALRAVHEDVVALEEVPHHRDVRRPIDIDRPNDGEALLFKERSLLRRELLARHRAGGRCASTLMTAPLGSRTKNRRTPQGSSVRGWTISAPAASALRYTASTSPTSTETSGCTGAVASFIRTESCAVSLFRDRKVTIQPRS